ncbi:MAG TPA: hypothetical protein VGD72_07415 [Mycobacteriales bacterium]|jgi:hypothetical protein
MTLPGDDETLLAELRDALASAGPIGEHALAQARGAYAWRTVDEDLALAELVYDSSVEERALVRGAAASAVRTLVFEGEHAVLEVEVAPDAVSGRVVPASRMQVSLDTPEGTARTTTTDDMGGFTLGAPPSGPVKLRCRSATAHVATEWIRL